MTDEIYKETRSLTDKISTIENEFSKEEQEILETVAKIFKGKTVSEIVAINHQEDAWIKNHQNRELIDYQFAFGLKAKIGKK